MKPYYDQGGVRILNGDCVETMAGMEPASVDAIVTDPPYGLGFMGKAWDDLPPGDEFAAEAFRVLKPGGHLLAFGGTRTYHRLTCAVEDAGFEIRDCLAWMYGSGFPKSLDVSKAIDKAAGAERDVVGTRKRDGGPAGMTAAKGWNSGPMASDDAQVDVTAPATDAAKEWDGWGTALKPAFEPVVMARKPLPGTVAANVQEHGTGALNVDGCRIGTDERTYKGSGKSEQRYSDGRAGLTDGRGAGLEYSVQGRWPANVVLDEEAAAMLDEQSGDGRARGNTTPTKRGEPIATAFMGGGTTPTDPGDSGGASRFFYTAKASRAERNGETGGANNIHPTVKPIDLMRWLVRLVTPPGGVVLDPFLGSGTTAVAARDEGFRCIGIEREAEYCAIAAKRLAQGVLDFGGGA